MRCRNPLVDQFNRASLLTLLSQVTTKKISKEEYIKDKISV